MPTLTVTQLRSGEGSILTDLSNLGPESLPETHAHLFTGDAVMLAASPAFAAAPPAGAERLEGGLVALRGDAARAALRGHASWTAAGGIFAVLPAMPDGDARRRCIPDALRPWDPDRLRASAYGQIGARSRFAHRGLWFHSEGDRRLHVEAGVRRVLESAGARLPNGDVTLVLEMPTDSTFQARFQVRGQGEAVRLTREFPSLGLVKEWRVARNEWSAVERRTGRSGSRAWRERLVSAAASTGIFVLSIPTFLVVLAALVVAKVTGDSAGLSRTSVRARPRDTQ